MSKNTPLVSILIPTFNRADLIGETLDSVIAQTYPHWECIVIDDGSADQTAELLQAYRQWDDRFQYYGRSPHHLPGGNGARNEAFERSKGALIQFFDSDDLMVPEMLEWKVRALMEGSLDFVLSKTKYIDQKEEEVTDYHFNDQEITFEDFATGPVSWYTPDMMLRREIASKLSFNENIRSGQEYNYGCKLLLATQKGRLLSSFTTLRRATPNSIGNARRSSKDLYLQTRFVSYWQNYLELNQKAGSKKFNQFSLLVCVSCYFQGYPQVSLPSEFWRHLKNEFGIGAYFFRLGKLSVSLFGKYHYFYRKLKNSSSSLTHFVQ